ncbi:hypothetical protein [Bradyrhizobium sp. MOS002]|uniref:DUF6894 family protein n=1 Tax=Bradyrhizobium sp. MOS002 TaxID=2133947 RepID=UPI000D11AC6D|nr:hypothetical protein [Bradyrhizobium sp. MOS002]PSO17512.1 hypothetical protein C7G41_36120 [Bradyrhizobium sp. MOS002]
MPRFYFDVHHVGGIIIDDEGIDLPDLRAAGKQALVALGEAILHDADELKSWATKIEVRDAAHRVVLRRCGRF